MAEYYGHSDNPHGQWQLLRDHLQGVARRTQEHLKGWQGQAEGEFCGLAHDLGKYPDSFQDRLRGIGSGLDHWSAGAFLALQQHLLASAFAIYGHHVGLPCKSLLQKKQFSDFGVNHPNNLRLTTDRVDEIFQRMEDDGVRLPTVTTPILDGTQGALEGMLQVRRLFSALTDADFLDTEEHMRADARPPGRQLEVQTLLPRLEEHLGELRKHCPTAAMLAVREQVLAACREAANKPPGVFTLAAPTGAGKTLAMLAFALHHCKVNGLRRIITVLPFLTLIEQTVAVYRRALRPHPEDLLEHHSLAGEVYDDCEQTSRRLRLLTENWDAPMVVTTSVQFLESLFAHKPSICRKLHRIAGSVILLDEVQTIPVELAKYTLGALTVLAQRWGCTILMATATQPAFEHLSSEVEKLKLPQWRPTPIVPDTASLFAALRRTKYEFVPPGQPLTDDNLADRLQSNPQALVVVNLKRQARSLYEKLVQQGRHALHLSTRNCPSHRSEILSRARTRLKQGAEVVLVSTQCIEAGVDVDFPRLFRAYAPLDSLVQAAGRCNREGLLDSGLVTVYQPEDATLPGSAYRQATQRTRVKLELWLNQNPAFDDPSQPDQVREYFESLYSIATLTPKELDIAIKDYSFPEVRKHYRLIAEDTINILVPYAPEIQLYQQLKAEAESQGISRSWILRARPITVSEFRPKEKAPILAYLQPLHFRAWRRGPRVEVPDWFIYLEPGHYHPELGLIPPVEMPEFVI